LPLHCPRYLPGFYLGNNYLVSGVDQADYVVASNPFYLSRPFLKADENAEIALLSNSLTPHNTQFHVFDTASIETRRLPDDAAALYYFGDSLSLQKWELRSSVGVQPCQRVHIESWWRLEAQPTADYSMQIALVNADGEAVSSDNRKLTQTLTGSWEPDAYYLDMRIVEIPCDVHPGEYPLVLSVYDPKTVFSEGALPVQLADGSPFNNYVYLTTLFVE
jgi:hypothetical protein